MRVSAYQLKALSRRPLVRGMVIGVALVVTIAAVATHAQVGLGGSSPVASTATAVNLQKGLVGWWKMDGNARDSSAYGINGTWQGDSGAYTTDRKGTSSKAGLFNGTRRVILPITSKYEFSNRMTVASWIKVGTFTTAYQAIVTKGDTSWRIHRAGSGNNLAFDTNGANPSSLTSSTNINDGNWHFVVGTYDGAVKNLYIDGALSATASVTGNIAADPTKNVMIGNNYDEGARQWNGAIDETRLYDRALSNAEVRAMYEQYDPAVKAAAGSKGLVGWWKMDGNARDSSPYGNNGVVNGATLTTDRKGAANAAYYFSSASNEIIPSNSAQYNFDKNNFSLSLWFKTASVTAGQDLIKKENAGAGYGLYISGAAELKAYVGTHVAYYGPVAAGVWNHVSAVRVGNTLYTYLNGVQFATTGLDANDTATSIDVLHIGRNSASTSIDDVRLYSRALSATEIKAQYDSYNAAAYVGGSGAADSDVQSGAVARYAMDGNANDTSGNGNNATNNGATLTTDRKGNANSAYSFDGTSSHLSVPNSSSLTTGGSTGWSMSAWIKPTNTTGPRSIFRKSFGGSGYVMYVYNGQLGSLFSYDASTNFYQSEGGAVATNQWQHVAVVYDNGRVTHYINGAAVYTNVYLSRQLISNGETAAIGRQPTGSEYFAGSLDEVQVYNRALSASDVARIAGVANVSLGKGLIGQWAMDGNARDSSPYANNGIVTGATLAADRKARLGSSYGFNGTSQLITVLNNSALNFGTGDFSYSMWFKSNVTPTQSMQLINKVGSNGYEVQIGSDGSVAAYFNNATVVSAAGTVQANTWYALSATRSGSTITLYINGVLKATANTSPATVSGTADLIFGKDPAYNEYLNGNLDDIRLYNRALNAGEVKALYEGYN